MPPMPDIVALPRSAAATVDETGVELRVRTPRGDVVMHFDPAGADALADELSEAACVFRLQAQRRRRGW